MKTPMCTWLNDHSINGRQKPEIAGRGAGSGAATVDIVSAPSLDGGVGTHHGQAFPSLSAPERNVCCGIRNRLQSRWKDLECAYKREMGQKTHPKVSPEMLGSQEPPEVT